MLTQKRSSDPIWYTPDLNANTVDAEDYNHQSLDQFRDQAHRAGNFDHMLEQGFPSENGAQANIQTAAFTITPEIAQ
ncbi:hypothetical protein DSO57_1017030 [Entomophthora muscae]|uniref:Uncharacterized protein n=1 Tax=Entomophthora muscae TaxID=34485 RepID=A0ACC2TRU4_9FUNG|nr:hypothetical protein DSO57_1017030 [Entomophthora muscae]